MQKGTLSPRDCSRLVRIQVSWRGRLEIGAAPLTHRGECDGTCICPPHTWRNATSALKPTLRPSTAFRGTWNSGGRGCYGWAVRPAWPSVLIVGTAMRPDRWRK